IFSERWAPKFVAIAKDQNDLGKIELEPGTALEGTVRDASGNPVAGGVVAMRSGYDGESSGYSFAAQLATKTDAEGHYRLPPARGGYKVYLAMAGQSEDRVDNPFVVGTTAPPLA